MNKMKTALVILGIGLGLSTMANAGPDEAGCESLLERCFDGERRACAIHAHYCGFTI